MDFGQLLIYYLTLYQIPAIFVGSFFFGETVIFTAALLSGEGLWSPFEVFFYAFLGTVLSDSAWFLAGSFLIHNSKRIQKYKADHIDIVKKLEKITGDKPFLALLFIKFMYGTRILMITYLSFRKTSFKVFTLFNCIGTIIWLIIVVGLGWLAGKGIINLIPSYHQFSFLLLSLIAIIIIFRYFAKWIQKIILKK